MKKALIVVSAILVSFVFVATSEASPGPGWWNNNWGYRAPITLTVHPENYQIRIVLDKVDNLGSHCLDNFQDLRFTENDDGPELAYWIENYISGDSAVVWVRRVENDVTCGDNTIYVYYGNSEAEQADNGDNVFITFDNFEDAAQGDWTTEKGTVDYDSTDKAWGGSQSMKVHGKSSDPWSSVASIPVTHGEGIIIRFRYFKNDDAGRVELMYHGDGTEVMRTKVDSLGVYYNDGDWQYTGHNITGQVWNLVEFEKFDWTGHKNDIILGEVKIADQVDMLVNVSQEDVAWFESGTGDTYHVYIDDFVVRKYADPEPTATVGTEEGIPPTKPERDKPIENQPYFEWSGTLADNYRLLVDNDPDFSSPKENRVIGKKTITIYGDNADGRLSTTGTNYTTIHDAEEADDPPPTNTTISVGQFFGDGDYVIYRGFVYFDTSVISDELSDEDEILSVTLSLFVFTDGSGDDFNVTVQNGQPTYPHNPFVKGDYYYAHYSGDGGSANTSDVIDESYFDIPLNSIGLEWIDMDNLTKLCLRSDEEIDNSAPTGLEFLAFRASEFYESGWAPKLIVTYVEPSYYQTPAEDAYENDTYYWKVIAYNATGENESDTWSFVVGTTGEDAATVAFIGEVETESLMIGAMLVVPLVLAGFMLWRDKKIMGGE